jgi:hypothetical protein
LVAALTSPAFGTLEACVGGRDVESVSGRVAHPAVILMTRSDAITKPAVRPRGRRLHQKSFMRWPIVTTSVTQPFELIIQPRLATKCLHDITPRSYLSVDGSGRLRAWITRRDGYGVPADRPRSGYEWGTTGVRMGNGWDTNEVRMGYDRGTNGVRPPCSFPYQVQPWEGNGTSPGVERDLRPA